MIENHKFSFLRKMAVAGLMGLLVFGFSEPADAARSFGRAGGRSMGRSFSSGGYSRGYSRGYSGGYNAGASRARTTTVYRSSPSVIMAPGLGYGGYGYGGLGGYPLGGFGGIYSYNPGLSLGFTFADVLIRETSRQRYL